MNIRIDKERLMTDWENLHNMPEIGFCEYKTSAYLRTRLESMGFEVHSIAGTGLLATLRGEQPGKSVGLRADIDALEFHDEDGSSVMLHACGHDAHSAMVLNVGELAVKTGLKKGTLHLLFQPAEETLCGASKVIADGGLPHLDALFGMHLRPGTEMPIGKATAQLMHQAARTLTIKFLGKAAHGARPHQGINALSAAAAAIARVDALKVDTKLSWSAKATNADCYGNGHNIIPECCAVVFDLRAQTNDLAEQIQKIVLNCAEESAEKVGCKMEKNVICGYAAEYDPFLVSICEEAIRETLGSVEPPLKTLGSEDFHAYSKEAGIPVAYMGLGADLVPELHSREMTFDKNCMMTGVEIFYRCVSKLIEFKN